MRYIVYGAGAVGGTIGARLFEAGRDVMLIARGRHYAALAADGLTYRDPDGSRVLPIPAVDHPSAVRWRNDDVVVLAVKSQATLSAVEALAPVAPLSVAIVCAQNGVENERSVVRRFPNVFGMCVMMPATHLNPGEVSAESLPLVGVLDLGRYVPGDDDVARHMAADLSSSGFRSRADPAIMGWKYEKLLLNLNTAVRALCGLESADSELQSRLRLAIADALRTEALACFRRAGIERPTADERAARWDGAVTRRPIAGLSQAGGSAWQDLARQSGTSESDYINGEIALLGRLHGVSTPTNEMVQILARRHAALRRPPGSMRLEDLAEAVATRLQQPE